MHLDPALFLAKLRPPKHRQTKVDRCGIKGVNGAAKLEDIRLPSLSGLLDHEGGELLEDAVIAIFVSLSQIASSDRAAHSEVVKFSIMGFHRND